MLSKRKNKITQVHSYGLLTRYSGSERGYHAAGEEPADVAKYLRANKVDTVMGPLEWSATGDLKNFKFGVYQWHADGSSSVLQ
jgi:hypothetical protein